MQNKFATFAGVFLGAMVTAFILIPSVYGADTIFLIQKDGSAPISSCVESNGLVLAQNLTDLCDVVIINPMTNEILGYNGTHWINIATSADNTVCTNVGTGAQVYKDGECNFRTILGSSDISVTQQANTVTIDFNGTAGGDTTTCNNVGGGVGLICQGGNIDLKSLVEGSNIDITNGVDTITIAVTGITSESTACNNVGTGVQLCSGGNVNMDTLIAGTGISITDTTDDWTIANTAPDNTVCTNLGSGLGVYASGECDFNSLIAGTGVTIVDTTDDLTITNTSPDLLVQGALITQGSSQTKTNIGTSYVDLYTDAIETEDMAIIDCTNVADIRVVFNWDYIGTGNQQFRIVDASNNANVLFESATFTTDRIGTDSDWFTKPAWCSGTGYYLEGQGKSDVAIDDPQTLGYFVYIR